MQTFCDINQGIDPGPSPARSQHKRYQTSATFFKNTKAETGTT